MEDLLSSLILIVAICTTILTTIIVFVVAYFKTNKKVKTNKFTLDKQKEVK